MKQLSPEFEAHLKSGSTTLCWCWRLTRRDGVVSGFTDHDRDVSFDGTVFEAVQCVGGLIGTLLTIYGRTQAQGFLMRRPVNLKI